MTLRRVLAVVYLWAVPSSCFCLKLNNIRRISTFLPAALPPALPSSVVVLSDADAVAREVFARVDQAARFALKEKGHFALAIPGGSILKMLKGTKPDWASKTTVCYVNHKCVDMADEKLSTHAKAQTLFMSEWSGVDVMMLQGSSDSKKEAAEYTKQLQSMMSTSKICAVSIDGNKIPQFDMMLIGGAVVEISS